jgi:hypothetical protein
MANYLELDSTYRNRLLWPKQGEFEVLLANSNNSMTTSTTGTLLSGQTVQEPISISEPVIAWTGLYFNELSLGTDFIRGDFVLNGLGYGNTNSVVTIEVVPPYKFQQKYNYYINAVLRNLTQLDQIARIIEYKYLGNDVAQVVLSSDNFKFDLGDSFFIGDTTDLSDPDNGFLFVPTGSTNRQDYLNLIIYNDSLQESRPVADYDGPNGRLLIGGDPVFLWQGFHNYSLRQQPPNFTFTTGAGSTVNQVVITGTGISNDMYTNWFIRITSSIYGNSIPAPETETRHITAYNPTTNIATVFPPFTADPTGLIAELSQYGYENANGLTWGFRVVQQVPIYHIKLKRLILPNKVLRIGNGGKPAYQSHFYVEIGNVDPTSSSTFLIFSNSPYSTRAMFRCSVKQIPEPDTQEYVVLKGDGMTQTARFRLDANMYIKVTLAKTGEIFETVLPDSTPPAPPKSDLQINALFEFIPA